MQWQVIVEGYREAQLLQGKLIADLRLNGALVTRPVAEVSELILDTLLPLVPVQTGTLQASQIITLDDGAAEAVISSSPLRNPLFGGFADDYVYDVVQRKPFYDWAMADLPDLEDTVLSAVMVELEGLL